MSTLLRVRPRVLDGLSDDEGTFGVSTRYNRKEFRGKKSKIQEENQREAIFLLAKAEDLERQEKIRREVENEIDLMVQLKLSILSDESEGEEFEIEKETERKGVKKWARPKPGSMCDLNDGLSDDDNSVSLPGDEEQGDDLSEAEQNENERIGKIRRRRKPKEKNHKKSKGTKKIKGKANDNGGGKGKRPALIDVEVEEKKSKHSVYVPPYDEPLTASMATSVASLADQRWKDGKKTVIYDINNSMKSGSKNGCKDGCRDGCRDRCKEGVEGEENSSSCLTFNAGFESANLAKATRVGNFEYDLELKTDVGTGRHTQWYYFEVSNTVAGVEYQFNITNLLKKDSLYNHGLRPLMRSQKEAKEQGKGWTRTGTSIGYSFHAEVLGRSLYKLSWRMEFPHSGDTCHLAHCYPYTYTDLQDYLDKVLLDQCKSQYCKIDILCQTKAERSCPILTITDPSVNFVFKKCVVVSGRVHPGETNSSWIVQGLIDFLLSADSRAQELREAFIFKIIPMLNPDGVSTGNYRCSLAGVDLNRQYIDPNETQHPTVYHLKKEIESTKRQNELLVYCDFHGHSRQQNVFMYGCKDGNTQSSSDLFKHKLFPWIMSQKAPGAFSYSECKYRMKKCKEGTGRIVMRRQFGILNSFTMETSFAGTTMNRNPRHFNCGDLLNIGQSFAEAVLDYWRSLNNAKVMSEYCQSLTVYLSKPRGMEIGRQYSVPVGGIDRARLSVTSRLEELIDQQSDTGSESEDSCSDSDSESNYEKSKVHGSQGSGKSKKKKKKRSRKKEKETAVAPGAPKQPSSGSTSLHQKGRRHDIKRSQSLPALDVRKLPAAAGAGRARKSIGAAHKFINRYANRSNGGIPMFSQERIEERMRKRQEKVILEQKERVEELTSTANDVLHPRHFFASHSHRQRPNWCAESFWSSLASEPAPTPRPDPGFLERSISLAPQSFLFSNLWTPVMSHKT
eukprot:m.83426 g.83426  ORF g.83426 m.83426 type:complete len:960 (+) comp36345_c0_seq11:27-2906(+)